MPSNPIGEASVVSTFSLALGPGSDSDPPQYPDILGIEVKCLVDNFSDRPVYPRWQKSGVPSILVERSSRSGSCFEFSGNAPAMLSSVANQC